MRRRDLPGGIAPPTKTELKRQAHAVQDVADRLVAAPAELVDALGLPDKLADAIALARRIPAGGARVRQRQFVAKLLRGLDPGPIRAALDARDATARVEAARFRRAERWRERLVNEGDAALAEFLSEHPVDGEALRRRVSAAVNEIRSRRPSGAGRELFRHIRDILDGALASR